MGRVKRVDIGGTIYHALKRANFRSRLFKKAAHYEDFLGIVEERPTKKRYLHRFLPGR